MTKPIETVMDAALQAASEAVYRLRGDLDEPNGHAFVALSAVAEMLEVAAMGLRSPLFDVLANRLPSSSGRDSHEKLIARDYGRRLAILGMRHKGMSKNKAAKLAAPFVGISADALKHGLPSPDRLDQHFKSEVGQADALNLAMEIKEKGLEGAMAHYARMAKGCSFFDQRRAETEKAIRALCTIKDQSLIDQIDRVA